MATHAQPVQNAAIFAGLAGSIVSNNCTMLNQFLYRLRSFSLGYGTLSIIYLIYGLSVLFNDQNYVNNGNTTNIENFIAFEFLISFFFLVASILLFQISIPANIINMTTIFLFSPMIPIFINIALMTTISILYNDLPNLIILVLNGFYLGLCYQYIRLYHKNLETFKQILESIPTYAVATPIQTPLIQPTISPYDTPSNTWTTINSPSPIPVYIPPTNVEQQQTISGTQV